MPFQLSSIQTSKNSISPPEDVSLSFTLTASAGVGYVIYYHLAPSNNLFFRLADGTKSKEYSDGGTLGTSVGAFNETLHIVSEGKKAYSFFSIKVTARSGLNGDVKSCKISIS